MGGRDGWEGGRERCDGNYEVGADKTPQLPRKLKAVTLGCGQKVGS